MTIADGVLLFGAMLVLALLPSASVALVIARSVTHGVHHGIAAGVGIVAGDLTFLLLAILGLAAVAEILGGWFMLLRLIGAAYLIWLGWSLLRHSPQGVSPTPHNTGKAQLLTSLLAGFALTLGDVKAIFFYLSLLPMFIDPAATDVQDLSAIIAITVLAVGSAKVFYAVTARRVATSLAQSRAATALPKVAGAALVGAGAYVAIKP